MIYFVHKRVCIILICPQRINIIRCFISFISFAIKIFLCTFFVFNKIPGTYYIHNGLESIVHDDYNVNKFNIFAWTALFSPWHIAAAIHNASCDSIEILSHSCRIWLNKSDQPHTIQHFPPHDTGNLLLQPLGPRDVLFVLHLQASVNRRNNRIRFVSMRDNFVYPKFNIHSGRPFLF